MSNVYNNWIIRGDRVKPTAGSAWMLPVSCVCSPDRVVYRKAYSVLNGRSKSCGCLKAIVTSERNRANRVHGVSVGDVFGRLSVIDVITPVSGPTLALVVCKCGTQKTVEISQLLGGRTNSCGCLRSELIKEKNTTHGLSRSHRSLYSLWSSMLERCQAKESKSYPNYGGRGITVSESWQSFENFLRDMGEKPDGKSLDRIDNNAGYSKENCRWASAAEQQRNTRRNVVLAYEGADLCLKDIALKAGVGYMRLRYQVVVKGLGLQEALTYLQK